MITVLTAQVSTGVANNMGKYSPQSAPRSSASPVVSGECRPQEAIARLGGLMELYSDVVGRFLNDSAGSVRKLRAAAMAGDLIKARDAAHSLKGLAAMCGAVSVAGVAAAIEQAAQSGHDSALLQLVPCLEAELSRAAVVLEVYRPRENHLR